MGNKSNMFWDLYDRTSDILERNGLEVVEREYLHDFEESLIAMEVGIALMRHGNVPRDFVREPHPWLVTLLAHLGPGRILRYLDLPLPTSKTA
jgi:hypothetical protein